MAAARLLTTLAAGLLLVGCMPTETGRPPSGPMTFADLRYRAVADEHRAAMLRRYASKDISYVLSLLDYALTSMYAAQLDSAKTAFTAAYRIEDGSIAEAAKFYQWLQVDSRTVYRMTKRERELIHLYLGLIYLCQDDIEGALVELKKLRKRDQGVSQLPVVNFYSGLVYEKLELYDDALIEYRGLDTMRWVNSTRFEDGTPSFPGSAELVERVEMLRSKRDRPRAATVDLVVHVDHQYFSTSGPTEVLVDGERVATLPPYVDVFAVRQTEHEAARKAAQEATAHATRQGLRCCMTLAAQRYLGDNAGEVVADIAGDIAFGDERRGKDPRSWRYAPAAISLARIVIPAGTNEVTLRFRGRTGSYLGECRYPLRGSRSRAYSAAGCYFVIAGLAREFYIY